MLETEGKIITRDQLPVLRDKATSDQQTVVWTNGCFDLLHVGHVYTLQTAAKLGDLLVVGLNSDRSIVQLKGEGRPVVGQRERALLLSALECVDYVTIFEELTPVSSITQLRPDIHCKGADYAPPDGKPIPEAELVRAYGGRIEFIPLLPAHSTTDLVDRARQLGTSQEQQGLDEAH